MSGVGCLMTQKACSLKTSGRLSASMSLATTYSPTFGSTIGAAGLNYSVRNGKRWTPRAIVTKNKLY